MNDYITNRKINMTEITHFICKISHYIFFTKLTFDILKLSYSQAI